MIPYLTRRLLLLPVTLFCIVLINFVIINLAPGDPTTLTDISEGGEASRSEERSSAVGEDQYLQFRERYGLTLPILFNTWPNIGKEKVLQRIEALTSWEGSFQDYSKEKVLLGDQARYIMPALLAIAEESSLPFKVRKMAVDFFIRGGSRIGHTGAVITKEQKRENRKISLDNSFLLQHRLQKNRPEKLQELQSWFAENQERFTHLNTWSTLFLETRFARYLSRVLTLDFGTLRNDDNRTVVYEVTKRFKYSLTLSVLPMVITFFLCQFFGFTMALYQGRWLDLSLNVLFLVLYAIPIFVVAPFLIEKVALNHTFPFTDAPIPINGFTSSERIYNQFNSWERIVDVLRHICLPLVAILYGSLATQSRLSRTAVLEVLRQDYVRTARAKGLHPFTILYKHVGRNAAITILTSIAGSLGIILGGSLFIEVIFGIDGFGWFFYQAILNRDYNVIMFSALASSFLTLLGYLIADITYTFLDPRVTLD